MRSSNEEKKRAHRRIITLQILQTDIVNVGPPIAQSTAAVAASPRPIFVAFAASPYTSLRFYFLRVSALRLWSMPWRSCLPAWPQLQWSLPTCHIEPPAWLTNCLGFNPGARQDFTFDNYYSDEFDHLLSADPTSGSFLSRLPFKRGTVKRPAPATENSSDGSLRSLFVDDRDAELYGDESINMLLTSQPDAAVSLPELPLGHQPGDEDYGQDDADLRREEEEVRREEEAEIENQRQRAKQLAIKRGLLRAETAGTVQSTSSSEASESAAGRSRSARSPSVKSQMSMVVKSPEADFEETAFGILPHMRPS